MAGHRIIIRDQEGDYVPVSYQFAGTDGAALDPTAASLIVYAADTGGAAWPTAGITGSPFTLAKIASKTGWYGVRIAKTSLPAGRYNFRIEATVDGVSAAMVERVDVLESGDFAADVSTLETRLSATRAGYLDKLNVSGVLAHSDAASTYKADVSALATSAALATVDSVADAIKAKTDALPADPAGVSDLPDVSGLSTFDSATDTVDVGRIAGAEYRVSTTVDRDHDAGVEAIYVASIAGIEIGDVAVVLKAEIAGNQPGHVGTVTRVSTDGDFQISPPLSLGVSNGSVVHVYKSKSPQAQEISAEVDVVSVAGAAVSGVADFRATGFSTHDPADVRAELAPELSMMDAAVSSRLADADYTAPPDTDSIATAVWAATTRTLTGFGTLVSDVATAVWGAATRTLSAFGFAVETDAASRAASQADVSALATEARIDALEAHGDLEWATGTGSGSIDVAAIADAVWDEALAGHVAAGSAGAKLGAQFNPPSSAIADYRADVSALATSAELAALEAHGDANWATGSTAVDYSAIADAVLTEAIVDHSAVEGSVAEALGRLDADVSSITVDAGTIHSALDTWEPQQAENPAPVILPPEFADDCRLWMAIGQQAGAQGPPADIGEAYCQIVGIPYYKGGRYYDGQQFPPTYSPEGGTLHWDVVRGATVLVYVRAARIRETLTVPEAATHEIRTVT